MRKALLLAAMTLSLLGGGSVEASSAGWTAAGPWEAPAVVPELPAPSLATTPREGLRGPSTFAVGLATLAGLGLLRWRRKRYLAETAAL